MKNIFIENNSKQLLQLMLYLRHRLSKQCNNDIFKPLLAVLFNSLVKKYSIYTKQNLNIVEEQSLPHDWEYKDDSSNSKIYKSNIKTSQKDNTLPRPDKRTKNRIIKGAGVTVKNERTDSSFKEPDCDLVIFIGDKDTEKYSVTSYDFKYVMDHLDRSKSEIKFHPHESPIDDINTFFHKELSKEDIEKTYSYFENLSEEDNTNNFYKALELLTNIIFPDINSFIKNITPNSNKDINGNKQTQRLFI